MLSPETYSSPVNPLLLYRLVTQCNNARAERFCVYKFQGRVAPIFKETLPFSQNNRIDQEVVFINEVVFYQCVDKRGATGD